LKGRAQGVTGVLLKGKGLSQGSWAVPGMLCSVNTLERFKTFDRAKLMTQLAATIWDDIKTGAAEGNPALLGRFAVINFADLKLFRMYYW
jgi:ubiquitin-like modifier-activating enzyme ATG7